MKRVPRVWAASGDWDYASKKILLSEEATHHLLRVLRLSTGERFHVFDGKRPMHHVAYFSSEQQGSRGWIDFEEQGISSSVPMPALLVGQAILKKEAWQQVLQRGTELGATGFVPLWSDRSQRYPYTVALEEMSSKILRLACEQSGRDVLPRLFPILALDAWLHETYEGESLFGCLEATGHQRIEETHLNQQIRICIGPEGGWTERERERFLKAGWTPWKLSDAVLRADTASIAFVAEIRARQRGMKLVEAGKLC